jgi:putative Ca2+/H+ antiporter (TMEM165/GDT1 family)
MIQELIKAFMLIFIAEMGDKTQILAMAFATKYPVKKVLLGIFIGSFLNHGLAVLLGSYISNFVPINAIQMIAGFAFVGFALWTLKAEEEEEEEAKDKVKFGPVITVALAFFIGELGDKTQLTAITLATDALYPLAILCGTVLGMIVTGAVGIIVGKKLGDKIPEFAIKLIAAAVFMFFGVTKLYQTVPAEYLTVQNIVIFAIVIAAAVVMLLRPTLKQRKEGKESVFKATAKELYNYYNNIQLKVNSICLGVGNCGVCRGVSCIVGNTKRLIEYAQANKASEECICFVPDEKSLEKNYNRADILEGLKMTLDVMKKEPSNMENESLDAIRRNFEMLLFGRSIEKVSTWKVYEGLLTEIDETIAVSLLKDL